MRGFLLVMSGILNVFLPLPSTAHTAPVTHWVSRTSAHGTDDIYAVAYNGSNLFVAVGNLGDIQTSPDGITWTAQTSPLSSGSLYSVAFGNGVFVAGGVNGTGSPVILRSTNGTSWSTVFTDSGVTDGSSAGVSYGTGNNWVAVSGHPSSYSSSNNGLTWTAHAGQTFTLGSGDSMGVLAFDGTNWLIPNDPTSGVPAHEAHSTNGTTWTDVSLGVNMTSGDQLCIAYGNGIYITAGGLSGNAADGVKFTSATGTGATHITSFNFPVGTSEVISIGFDGTSTFLAVGDNSAGGFGGAQGYASTSTDGVTWTNAVVPNGVKGLNGAVWNGSNSWVVVGTGGTIQTYTP